ncbi:serine/threonine protein kinase [Leptolyngbya sp. NIES-3755]|nr:serine/threonine protein kinase [Leptolyngbya sp. NIES-3755]
MTILNDRYHIKTCLSDKPGRRTYLAQDQDTQVVIKCLTLDGQATWEDLKLFDREAQVLQTINHPAIPKYLDSFEIDNGYALIQTYLEARSLKDHIETSKPLNESEVVSIAQQVLEILNYLHDRHPPIIHRDIKPSNILWDGKRCYLIDFGAVQTLAAKAGETFTIVGTYGYMPPEQFGGRTLPVSDLYSLGTTLIYLLTGIHPAELPQVNGQLEFEAAVQCSPAFCCWIRTLIQVSPSQRFSSARSALEALKQINAPTKTHTKGFSDIKILSNAHELLVIIPKFRYDAQMNWGTLFGTTFMLAIFSSFFLWNAIAGSWGILAFFYVLLILAGNIVLWLISSYTEVYLRLTLTEVSLTYNFLGLKFKIPRPSAISDLVKIVLKPAYHYTETDSEGGQRTVVVYAELLIWTGKRKYRLRNLEQREADWIAGHLRKRFPVTIVRVKNKPD